MNHRLLAVTLGALALCGPARAADPTSVTAKAHEGRIDLYAGTQLVATYHHGKGVPKPYLWPLHAPGGVPVTRAWPIVQDQEGGTNDHVHQKSAWFCHGDVIPEGITVPKARGVEGVDFWAEGPNHGVIACLRAAVSRTGAITADNEWRSADGKKVLDERQSVALHDLGGAYLVVVTSELTASAAPVAFGDTKEGSFGVRVSDQLLVKHRDRNRKEIANPKSVIRNADGKTTEKECWGQASAWCDYSGEVGGKAVGVAVFADPANPHPTCWHVRDYGLLAANPFGREKSGFPAMKGRTDLVKLGQGERLKLRYGIYLHAGNAEAGKVAEAFEKFAKLRE
jgi:hypothetical protein